MIPLPSKASIAQLARLLGGEKRPGSFAAYQKLARGLRREDQQTGDVFIRAPGAKPLVNVAALLTRNPTYFERMVAVTTDFEELAERASQLESRMLRVEFLLSKVAERLGAA